MDESINSGQGHSPTPQPARSDGAAHDGAPHERGAVWDEARQTARSRLNEQKDAAAARIDDVAAALRASARSRHDEHDTFARATESAAERLGRLSGSLRSKDVDTMLRDINGFAHEQPMAFFGLAVAAGFVAVRLVKTQSH